MDTIHISLRDTVFNQYELEKELKVSERGKVLLLRDKTTKLRYIYREFFGNSEVYRKMQGKACPYLPKIEAVEERDGLVFVVEEYIQGDTLAFVLKGGTLDEELAKRVTIQICHALEVLHSLGVIHRDIKPENIILRGSDAILIDFDASRLCKEERNTDTQVMGTAGYAAPEQYGFSQTDARADIYALGVLLNEMLVRQHPAKQLAEGKFLPVIVKCIEVNMDRRYGSAKELLAALEGILVNELNGQKKKNAFAFKVISVLLIGGVLIGGMLYSVSQRQAKQEQDQQEQIRKEQNQQEIVQQEQGRQEYEPIPGQEKKDDVEHPEETATSYHTAFRYDIDSDGQNESYVFGVAFQNVRHGELIDDERIGIQEGNHPQRCTFPCVWKYTEDGELAVAEEFAELLSQPETTVSCISNPALQSDMKALNGLWRGGLDIRYTSEHLGTWQYEASAVLDGEVLTAAATTTIYIYDGMQ